MSKVRLSERVRPDCEAAPWVVQEIKKLESENERLREALTYDWDQLEACRASLREHMVEMKRLRQDADRWQVYQTAGSELTLLLHNTRSDHRNSVIDAAMRREDKT